MKKKILGTAVGAIVAGTVIGMSHVGMAAEWQKPVYVPSDGESKGARVTYEYKDDSLFYVNTKLGFVNDIELRPGEVVTHIAGGDTKRWLIDKAIVGNVQHVYIKPIEAGIDTNIIINTNQRAYRLYVIVSDDYDPLISFTFPDSPASGQRLRVPEANPPVYGERVNRNYEIRVKKKADKALIPLEIFDDGRQTFIRISKDNKYDLPVLYSIDPWNKKNIAMVNYRVKGEYIIVDGVYAHGRLFYQQKFWIDFFNLEKKKTVKGTMPANRPERVKRPHVVYDDSEDEPGDVEATNISEETRKLEEARALKESRALERERREAEALQKEREKEERIRERQLLKEQEKQERIRQQKERENEQFLLQQQEREKEEILRQQREKERMERVREQEALREQEARDKEIARRQEEERNRQLAREEMQRRKQAAEQEELVRQQLKSEREEKERQRKLEREEKALARAAAKEQRIREREARRKLTEEERQIVEFRRKKQKEATAAYEEAEESYDEMYRNASADEGADGNVAPIDKETKEKIYREALERQQVYDDLYGNKGRKKKAGGRG